MFETNLDKAFKRWEAGRSITLTLAAKLMAEGYDVVALERKYKA